MDADREPTDRELLAAAGRDRAAFDAFYRRTVHRVVAFAAARCRTPEEVADLVAETYLAVIGSAHRYDPRRGDPLAWVCGIAANVHASQRRADRRRVRTIAKLSGRRLLDEDDHARLEEMIDAAALAPRVAEVVRALPAAQREIVELVSEGNDPTEAARLLGIEPAAARMRLARARAAIRRALADGEPPPSASFARRDLPLEDHA